MTPREELLRVFDTLVDNYHASRQETRAMLNQYAIGRWVSVEERLPDRSGCYLFVWEGGEPQWIDYTHGLTDGETPTHWLELNMPSGKGEA